MNKAMASLPDDPNHIVLGSLRFRFMLALANAHLMDYLQEKPDAPDRQKLHDDLATQFAKLDQVAGLRNVIDLKRFEAQFEIASGTDAEMQEIQDLNKLMTDDDAAAKDYYLQMLLAQAYVDTGETANAVATLNKVVLQAPRDKDARKRLIYLLMTDQPDQVPAHLDELAKQDPNDPDLNSLRLISADRSG
jgi:Tetratricopeptide repeat